MLKHIFAISKDKEHVMEPQAYAAIKEEWGKISNKEQRNLLYLYVKNKKNSQTGSWMEFLHDHFEVGDSSSLPYIALPRQQTKKLDYVA